MAVLGSPSPCYNPVKKQKAKGKDTPMSKALITGSSGALGSGLRQHLNGQGLDFARWDRQQTPVNDPAAMEAYIRQTAPDMLFHLATASTPTGLANEDWVVNVEWSATLATICAALDIPYLFTSSVMVFTDDAPGPFQVDSEPDATDGYGYEKRVAEERILAANPRAVVARIGWQIGEAPGSNNMIDFFETQMQEKGQIRASQAWLPACSFIPDTVSALLRLVQEGQGLYLLDSNDRWNFYEIACALNKQHGSRWQIVPTEDFVYDQRMIDGRARMPSLRERLPTLRTV
jgi:dTDP-4-dehydrorhamnose reductase